MGRRDEPELTPTEAELAEAEAATQRALARFAEPAQLAPPPDLAARVMAALPASEVRAAAQAAPARRRPRLSPGLSWTIAAMLGLLLILGTWGVLVNSLIPSNVAGGPAAGLGQLLLLLTLAAKPLINLFASAGALAALLALAALGGAWLWWRLFSTTPIAVPVEIRQ